MQMMEIPMMQNYEPVSCLPVATMLGRDEVSSTLN